VPILVNCWHHYKLVESGGMGQYFAGRVGSVRVENLAGRVRSQKMDPWAADISDYTWQSTHGPWSGPKGLGPFSQSTKDVSVPGTSHPGQPGNALSWPGSQTFGCSWSALTTKYQFVQVGDDQKHQSVLRRSNRSTRRSRLGFCPICKRALRRNRLILWCRGIAVLWGLNLMPGMRRQ